MLNRIFRHRDNAVTPQSNTSPAADSPSANPSSVGRRFSCSRLSENNSESIMSTMVRKAKAMMSKISNWCQSIPFRRQRSEGEGTNVTTFTSTHSPNETYNSRIRKAVRALFPFCNEITPREASTSNLQEQAHVPPTSAQDLTAGFILSTSNSSSSTIQTSLQTPQLSISEMVQKTAVLCAELVGLNAEYEEFDSDLNGGDKQLRKLEKQIELKEEEIKELDDQILGKINQEYFGIENKSDRIIKNVPIDFCYIKHLDFIEFRGQIKLNHMKNQAEFIKGVLLYCKNDSNKEEILNQLDKHHLFHGIDIKNIEVKIQIIEGGETHNLGKSPLFITFTHEGKELQIVYKPRDAATDQAVIKLFESLNACSPELSSLPIYKIYDTEEGSFWEFIQGTHPTGSSVAEAIRTEKKELTKNLERLEAVCKSVGATDLHIQNVILTENSIVPIDLEVVIVDAEQPTGLYIGEKSPTSDQLTISKKEEPFITDFIDNQRDRISRFVPIPTKTLIDLIGDGKNSEDVSETIYKECVGIFQTTLGYKIILDKNDFKNHLAKDARNGDIPYFTKKGDSIYYGVYKENQQNILVAKKSNQVV